MTDHAREELRRKARLALDRLEEGAWYEAPAQVHMDTSYLVHCREIAEFIAAASPSAVLALLQHVDKLTDWLYEAQDRTTADMTARLSDL